MKKSVKISCDVYTLNLEQALGDFKKLADQGVEVNLNTHTWGKHCYNLTVNNSNYNSKLIETIQEIIWHEDYVADTDEL